MAAIAIAYVCKIDLEVIKDVLMTFKGVEHRQEFVRNLDNVIYVNDSKGTNPDSTIKAIQSYDRPIILIAGGMDKEVILMNFLKLQSHMLNHWSY